ncbi:MAG: hypothetical protein ABIT05_12150 [Chitinophagaceae bacterium]
MKKLLVVLLSFAFISANAQTADEVIQKYSAAMGGLEAFNKISSAKMTGTVTAQGNDFPVTLQIIAGKAMRTDVDIMGQAIVNVYNNGTGWKINPFAGVTVATDVTGTELTDFKAQSSLSNHLMDYKNRGHKVEYAGQEKMENLNVYKIELTNKDDGKLITYYINAADYMLVKSVMKRDIQGTEVEVETFYSDIKDINGVKFAMVRTQTANGNQLQSIKLDKIELNVPIDANIFNK